jgi:hypothetical protein
VFEVGGIDLKAFAKKGAKGNIQRKITRFLKNGTFLMGSWGKGISWMSKYWKIVFVVMLETSLLK